MKTTIDIADDLIERARLVQKRDDVTLRSLVEEGLRMVLDKQAQRPEPDKFVMPTYGDPWHPGMPEIDVNAAIAEDNEYRVNKIFAMLEADFAEQAEREAKQKRAG